MPCERHGANTGYSPDQQKEFRSGNRPGVCGNDFLYRASGGKLDSIAVTAATAAGVTGGSACHLPDIDQRRAIDTFDCTSKIFPFFPVHTEMEKDNFASRPKKPFPGHRYMHQTRFPFPYR